MRGLTILAAALVLTGCGKGTGNDETTVAPAGNVAAAPEAPPAASGPLSAYIGKYPREAVGGVTFQAHPLVVAGVEGAVADADLRGWLLRDDTGPNTPIVLKDGKLMAWACEQHNCGDHNWTILIDPAGGHTQVCLHDAAKSGGDSLWYQAGAAADRKAGGCPSE